MQISRTKAKQCSVNYLICHFRVNTSPTEHTTYMSISLHNIFHKTQDLDVTFSHRQHDFDVSFATYRMNKILLSSKDQMALLSLSPHRPRDLHITFSHIQQG